MLNLQSRLARRLEWLAQLRLRRGFERAFTVKLKAEFDRVGREAKAQYLASGAVPSLEDHAINLHKVFIAMYVSIMTAFGKRLLSKVPAHNKSLVLSGAPGPLWIMAEDYVAKDTEDEITRRVQEFAKRWAGKKVTQVSNTTRQRINRAIARGVAENKHHSEIANDVYETTGSNIGTFRAEVIARTETHTASQAGSLESAKALGIPLRKEWVATSDDRTRDDHSDVSGEVLEMDDTFQVGDDELSFPGDPAGSPEQVINCRCVLVYENKERE